MGIRHDVEEGLEKYEVTKIEGQPTDEDLNQLTNELTNAAGSVTTQNGGREHGHVGMVVDEAEYVTFSHGNARFVVPTNPGAYPTTVDATNAAIRKKQIAEHKAEVAEYETYLGVQNWLRRMIVKAIDPEWLAEMESETMGFNHLSAKDLMTHLRNVGGTLDHMDITKLISNLLLKAGQAKNPKLRLAFALATFQSTGEFDPALRDWHAKRAIDKTFVNFRTFMQAEFGKHFKQNKSTAKSVGHGIANSVTDKQVQQMDNLEAQAMIFAELANSMQEQTQKQFMEMMNAFKATLAKNNSPNPTPVVPRAPAGENKKKLCPHCKIEVYHKPERCFELEANAARHPANWVSKVAPKST
ncbi:hypothetical protein ACHAW6_002955 [Cyclotella cf. meneghiniana]